MQGTVNFGRRLSSWGGSSCLARLDVPCSAYMFNLIGEVGSCILSRESVFLAGFAPAGLLSAPPQSPRLAMASLATSVVAPALWPLTAPLGVSLVFFQLAAHCVCVLAPTWPLQMLIKLRRFSQATLKALAAAEAQPAAGYAGAAAGSKRWVARWHACGRPMLLEPWQC